MTTDAEAIERVALLFDEAIADYEERIENAYEAGSPEEADRLSDEEARLTAAQEVVAELLDIKKGQETDLPITRDELLAAIREHYRSAMTDPTDGATRCLTIWPDGRVEHWSVFGVSCGENEYYGRVPHEVTVLRTPEMPLKISRESVERGYGIEDEIDALMDEQIMGPVEEIEDRMRKAFGVEEVA